ncbi:S-adenosylmethionine decarboxylase [Scheffersomyces xylosifermentans]|uniref:S-adenosylmethionine decarboxylase n=1 Tax=Scheffersomyces xylosifermentans TaxID=1304137 RepID=UPI00315C94AE
MVAPAYFQDSYVDHTLSANLDSTYAFEGPEKLLEIWFWPSEDHLPKGNNDEGLRCIPLNKWVEILDLVSCKILSMKSSKFMDAYLLSESSLFVFPNKIILKTCGTTTTLACLEKVFAVVNEELFGQPKKLSSHEIYKIFYSRRSFMFPDKQIHVHKDWKNEVKLLNEHFENGKSYIVGDFNSSDHWYLYVGGIVEDEDDKKHVNETAHDQTFEILMTELNPECAAKFITSRKPGAESLIENEVEDHDLGHDIGIATMSETDLDCVFDPSRSNVDFKNLTHLPSPSLSDNLEMEDEIQEEKLSALETKSKGGVFDFIHDAFSFSPCGYSSNSICSNQGGYYYTLHITPESGWSYASFETNYPFTENSPVSITDVLLRILHIFEPRKFSLTLISEDLEGKVNAGYNGLRNSHLILKDLGYKKQERVKYDLRSEYKLLYLNFEKSESMNCLNS